MDIASFRSVLAMLGVLGMFVSVVTNIWRYNNLDLSGRWANLRGVYARSITVGIVLATLLRANIIDILQNPEGPAMMLGWFAAPWADGAGNAEKIGAILYELFGVIVTGVVLAFLSKAWNDLFDILYEFKRWLRGRANTLKPEEGSQRPAPSTQASSRPIFASRRAGGGGGGGGGGGRGRRGGRGGRGRSSGSPRPTGEGTPGGASGK